MSMKGVHIKTHCIVFRHGFDLNVERIHRLGGLRRLAAAARIGAPRLDSLDSYLWVLSRRRKLRAVNDLDGFWFFVWKKKRFTWLFGSCQWNCVLSSRFLPWVLESLCYIMLVVPANRSAWRCVFCKVSGLDSGQVWEGRDCIKFWRVHIQIGHSSRELSKPECLSVECERRPCRSRHLTILELKTGQWTRILYVHC